MPLVKEGTTPQEATPLRIWVTVTPSLDYHNRVSCQFELGASAPTFAIAELPSKASTIGVCKGCGLPFKLDDAVSLLYLLRLSPVHIGFITPNDCVIMRERTSLGVTRERGLVGENTRDIIHVACIDKPLNEVYAAALTAYREKSAALLNAEESLRNLYGDK